MVSLKESLRDKIEELKLNLVPSSFDQIGSIAIFNEFPKELKKEEKIIANELLKINKTVKTVAIKSKKFSGKFRLQKVRIVAGIKTKETLHKESSCLFKLDVEKCYFTPRLSHERLRISKLVKNNELILVMFSGIAPFPIVISKHSKAKEIYAIELNPIANKYAYENLMLNKINNIKLFQNNVKSVLPKLKIKFDRIIMPAPKNAENYLNLLKNKLKKNTVIHFYDFCNERDFPDKSINKIKKHFKKIKILNVVKCGNISPYNYRICVDFQVL